MADVHLGLKMQNSSEVGLQESSENGLRESSENGLRNSSEIGLQNSSEIGLQESSENGSRNSAEVGLLAASGREKSFVEWLRAIASDASALYLLGDIFDFWWEYKYVVPKGYVRVLGALAQLVDSGVAVHFFKGNHDRWCFGYLEREIGIHIHNKPEVIEVGETRFCLGHGDGVELATRGDRLLSTLFSAPILQRCFAAVHPRWGVAIAHRWSAHNRKKYSASSTFAEEREPLCRFAQSFPQPVDCFVFGHLHIPMDVTLPNGARLVVLGEWMPQGCYAVFDESTKTLQCMDGRHGIVEKDDLSFLNVIWKTEN